MADEIIIEWGTDHLCVTTGTWSTPPQVHQCAERATGDHADSKVEIDAAAAIIKELLNELRLSGGPAVVVLPREGIVVRRLELPDAPDEELPDLVRFQAATKSAAPLDELMLDFIPMPRLPNREGREVVLVSVDRRRVERMQKVLTAAGLTVQRVVASPTTTAALVDSVVKFRPTDPAIIVFQNGARTELSIIDASTLVFSHALRLPAGDSAGHVRPLKAEINRSLVALSQLHEGVELRECILVQASPEDDAVRTLLSERFGDRLRVLSASECATGSGRMAPELILRTVPLIGALVPAEQTQIQGVDFLHPRRKREVRDRRPMQIGAAIAAVLLLMVVAYGMYRSRISALEDQIEFVNGEIVDLDAQLKKGEPRLESFDQLARWERGQADPLGLWNELNGYLPGTDRLYFVDLRFAPQTNESVAVITGTGFARDRSDADGLHHFLDDVGYIVKPTTAQRSRRDPDYPFEFELSVEVPREEPAEEESAEAELTAAAT